MNTTLDITMAISNYYFGKMFYRDAMIFYEEIIFHEGVRSGNMAFKIPLFVVI